MLLAAPLLSQSPLLQVRVLAGEGGIHAPGSRAARFLVIEVTDETGAPVAGASLNFRLPDEHSTGAFANGLRTDLITSNQGGRAAIPEVQFNRIAGSFEVRITAARGAARSSIVSTQYISELKAAEHRRGRWIVAGLALAGGAGASLAVIERGGAHGATPTDPNALSIGSPTISIGKPK